MKNLKIKETYLIFLIVIGLVSLSLYSTYALFTASTEITDVVNFTTSLTTDSSILEYEMVTIPAGESKVIELIVNNSHTSSIYYGAWYQAITNASDLSIGIYAEENNTPGTGSIAANSSLTVLVGITNNGSNEAIVNVGVVGSETSNLNLADSRVLITGEWTETSSISTPEATLTKLGLTVASGTPDFSKTSCSSGCDETTVGVYAAEDDLGTSYYFRGDVTNNYVKFADFYWRIIRINGDGSIRMIYDGTSPHANGESSTDRQIGTSAYNPNYNDNTYVGYMIGTTGATDYASAHSNSTDSTIKGVVDAWYKANIVDKGYSGSVVDAIYCNDRSLSSGTGIGTINTDYGVYGRLANNTSPTLKCSQKNDRFTTEPSVGSIEGNDKLIYPVGLITADELSMAGTSYSGNNETFYLYNGLKHYWTMSPFFFNFGDASVGVANLGAIDYGGVAISVIGVRPVITLSSSAITGGTGISTDPYKTS